MCRGALSPATQWRNMRLAYGREFYCSLGSTAGIGWEGHVSNAKVGHRVLSTGISIILTEYPG